MGKCMALIWDNSESSQGLDGLGQGPSSFSLGLGKILAYCEILGTML